MRDGADLGFLICHVAAEGSQVQHLLLYIFSKTGKGFLVGSSLAAATIDSGRDELHTGVTTVCRQAMSWTSFCSHWRASIEAQHFCRTPLTANEPLHNELGFESYPGDVSLPPHANCLSMRMSFIKRSTCRRRIHLEGMLDWFRALVQASAYLRRVVC